MRISEIIGILVLECDCGAKFVVNTEAVKEGFICECDCSDRYKSSRFGQLQVDIQSFPWEQLQFLSDTKQKEYKKSLETNNRAMPIAEYKALLATIIVDGKRPRIPAKNKNVVSFNTNQDGILDTVDALVSMGYNRADAKSKVDIAVSEGFYTEQEIIQRVLTL